MPIYAYRCEACGHTQDVIQKFSDAPLTDCPQCGASALRKQLTAPAFQLKGGGWYVTDFRDGGAKNKAAAQPSGVSANESAATPNGGAAAPEASASTQSEPAAPAAGSASA